MLEPDHPIRGISNGTVSDFWSWAYSNFLENRIRGVFAEFLVAVALGVSDQPRIEWNAYDLVYRSLRIEVKTSAYLQAWQQNGLSAINFDIAKKQGWDAATNTYADEPERGSDCYVFCVNTETDLDLGGEPDVANWDFYVIATARLDLELGNQKTIGLRAAILTL